jgi:hypothetical protein
MFERNISTDAISQALATAELVEDYADSKPYPSRLVLGWAGDRPIHIVFASNAASDETIIITAYEPDARLWKRGFMERKR